MTERMASQRLIWLMAGLNLLLSLAQLATFAPMVSGGRSFDLPFYRVDALNMAFGIAWTLALAIALPSIAALTRLGLLYICLLSLGLPGLAYARDPFAFALGWELAGLGLWLALREMGWAGDVRRTALAIHLPGLLLLAAMLLGLLWQFTPPQGGDTSPWPLSVALMFGAVALFRACYWLFAVPSSGVSSAPLIGLYILAAPFVLAKALVAAPWDAQGVWLLALMGTAALFISLFRLASGVDSVIVAASACAAICVVGFGLASESPLAAVGAVGLLIAGALWVALPTSAYRGALLFAGALPFIWLVSQGALDAGFRLMAALLLLAIFLALYMVQAKAAQTSLSIRLLSALLATLLIAAAIYPQAMLEWALRPAVGAMAGGVGVPTTLLTNWGVGLMVKSPQESVLAAMPATGIVLAIFLAWVALRALRGLVGLAKNDP